MTAPPYMPLYIGDWIADTLDFSTLEDGAYFRLVRHAWCHDATIPKDDQTLMTITGMQRQLWKRHKAKLLAKFHDAGAHFAHRRVARELANALKRRVPKRNKRERGSGIHKVGESLIGGETPRVAKIVPAQNGKAAQAAPKRLSEQSKTSDPQAELPIVTPKQKPKIPVSDELKYLVACPVRGARKQGRP